MQFLSPSTGCNRGLQVNKVMSDKTSHMGLVKCRLRSRSNHFILSSLLFILDTCFWTRWKVNKARTSAKAQQPSCTKFHTHIENSPLIFPIVWSRPMNYVWENYENVTSHNGKNNSWIRTKLVRVPPWTKTYPFTKFHGILRFCVILLFNNKRQSWWTHHDQETFGLHTSDAA